MELYRDLTHEGMHNMYVSVKLLCDPNKWYTHKASQCHIEREKISVTSVGIHSEQFSYLTMLRQLLYEQHCLFRLWLFLVSVFIDD